MQVKGDYGFIADDGRLYKVDYVADENGYRPTVAEPVEHPNH